MLTFPKISYQKIEYSAAFGNWLARNYSGVIKRELKKYTTEFYLPKHRLLIEFVEEEKIKKNKTTYFQEKTIECYNKNIRNIRIYEHEWKNTPEICCSLVMNALNNNVVEIDAEECTIQTITRKAYNDFLTENHIGGCIICFDKAFGLYHNKRLVAVASFGHPRAQIKNTNELYRYATKRDYKVNNGLKTFIEHSLKFFNQKSIVAYVDISHFEPTEYLKVGFKIDGFTRPIMFTVGNDDLMKKHSMEIYMKHNMYPVYNKKLSKTKNMINNGFHIIHTSGDIRLFYEV